MSQDQEDNTDNGGGPESEEELIFEEKITNIRGEPAKVK